jgi:hypothetical protein
LEAILMATVALTNIKHGNDDGTFVEFDEGDDVKASDFPKGVFDELKEAGAIGTPPVPREGDAAASELVEENDDLKKRVADLEKQLSEAKSSGGSTGGTGTKPPAK